MQKKPSLLFLFVLLLSMLSCDKTVTEPKEPFFLTPEAAPANPLVSNVPLEGLYYLHRMSDPYYSSVNPINFLPYKDSLIIKFTDPSFIEISMRIGRN